MLRRWLFGVCCLGITAGRAAAVTWPQLGLAPAITGLAQPTYIISARDGSGRLFVVLQGGTIRIIKNGVLQSTPFLDISTRVSCCGERGLLSVAFPPGYAGKGHFYVYYTNTAGNLVIARYSLTANPDVADASSEAIVLTIDHPTFSNHNGGQLAFGPDGYLYIGTGDGGSAGDPNGNGQNTNVLLAKVLRIDVESGATPYAIPGSNPVITPTPSRGEIWAYGLRNPWRFSFDRSTGDLYIGDVGQNNYEEVDFQPAASSGGQNYGWNIMEGLHCYNATTCNMSGLTLPVLEYDHSASNCAITGGFVYRGTQFARMQGIYFYGDYCTGRIWGLQRDGNAWVSNLLYGPSFNLTTFGEDEGGELYVGNASSGAIARMIDTGVPTATVTPTPTLTPSPTATATPTLTPTQVQVDLARGAGLTGGVACLPATLSSNGHPVASTSNDLGFDAATFPTVACTIASSIAAGSAANKELTQTDLGPGQERVLIDGVSGSTNILPDGALYSCRFTIAGGAVAGTYTVSNTPQASGPNGSNLPVSGAAGTLVVTACAGDCDGNGVVSIGEVTRAVNLFLGQDYCGCPIADGNKDGIVSIGEVIQSVNRFLTGCP